MGNVYFLWFLPFKPRQHGPNGAVPLAGKRQRTVKLHLYPAYQRQHAQNGKFARKGLARNHGANGMGTGRPYADLEQIKNAEHDAPPANRMSRRNGLCRNISRKGHKTQAISENCPTF